MKKQNFLVKWMFGDDSFLGQPIERVVGTVIDKTFVDFGSGKVWTIEVQLPDEKTWIERSLHIKCDPLWGNMIPLDTELPIRYQQSKYNWGTITGDIDFDRLEVKFFIKS